METQAVGGSTTAGHLSSSAASLTGDDFFKLLVAQLSNQDPLAPTSNEQLLQQISSIREIDLSSTLAQSLRSLTNQQRWGAAGGLIGMYVATLPESADAGSGPQGGMVVGVRFDDQGEPLLQLSTGTEVPMGNVLGVMDPAQAGRDLVGKLVGGITTEPDGQLRSVTGLVTNVSTDALGQVVLNLDTGQSIRLADVVLVEDPQAVDATI